MTDIASSAQAPSTRQSGDTHTESVQSGFTSHLATLHARLYRLALQLAKNHWDAEDLVQDTLARAMLARAHFQSGTNMAAWTQTILRNLFIDAQRRRRRDERLSRLPGVLATGADNADNPLDLLCLADVDEALAQVSKTHREAFTMAYLDGLSYQDIARHLGVPTNTTGTRVLRAKLRLRDLLSAILEQRLAMASTAPDVGSPSAAQAGLTGPTP